MITTKLKILGSGFFQLFFMYQGQKARNVLVTTCFSQQHYKSNNAKNQYIS